jgi:hypothetical protein
MSERGGGRKEGGGKEGGGRESEGATIIDVRVTVVRTARAKAIMSTTKDTRKKRSNEDMRANERGGGVEGEVAKCRQLT